MTTRIDHAARLGELWNCAPGCEGRCALCPDEVTIEAADYIRTLEWLVRDAIPAMERDAETYPILLRPVQIWLDKARALGLTEDK